MILDITLYRKHIIPKMKQILARTPYMDYRDVTGIVAATFDCPIVAVCYYLAEIRGSTPELTAFTQRMQKYHKVDKVKGILK